MFNQLLESMEQDWIEAIPVSLLQQWEIQEEVQNWIKTYNQQRLKQDQLYKEIVTQTLMLKDLLSQKMVQEHITDPAEVTSNPV